MRRLVGELRERLRALFFRRREEADLDEELRHHVEMETRANVHRGMSPKEARRRATLKLGGIEQTKEDVRRARGTRWLEDLARDLRYAGRAIGRAPGFAVAVVGTVALGIGATTVVFSLVNALLLRPLPVPDHDRLVSFGERMLRESSDAPVTVGTFSQPRIRDYHEASTGVLDGLAAYGISDLALRTDGPARVLFAVVASGEYFDVLGIQPVHGRFFGPEEAEPGSAATVAVIGHGLWRSHFGRDPSVVGRTVHLNGEPVTIVGVAPEGFGGTIVGVQADIWVPLGQAHALGVTDVDDRRNHIWLQAFGRLAPSVSHESAESALSGIAREIGPDAVATGTPVGVRLEPLTGLPQDVRGAVAGFMALLLSTAGLVLLIAGANVGGMLLARATRRRHELAVRSTLGASRGRLTRQLLAESVLLFGLGGAAGVLLSASLARLLESIRFPLPVPLALDFGLDLRVLGFALAVTLLAAVAFGLAPARRATGSSALPSALRENARRATGARTRLRGAFVVAQIAFSLLLLVTAGLLVRTLRASLVTDPGFDPDGVVVATFDVGAHGYDDDRGRTFFRSLVDRVDASPVVESAALARAAPLSGTTIRGSIIVDETADEMQRVDYLNVGSGYFRTLRIPIVAGRAFTAADRPGADPVAIVNQALASRLWPGEDPLGKRFRWGGGGRDEVRIVGVVRDARNRALDERPVPVLYLPHTQAYQPRMTLLVRSTDETAAAIARIRDVAGSLDPDIPARQATRLGSIIDVSLFPQRFAAMLIGGFGAIGLLLAVIGIYGVVSFHVGARTREIGVRLALGARPAQMRTLVGRHTLVLMALGIGVGLVLSLAVTRLLAGVLYGVRVADPLTYVTTVAILTTVGMGAAYVPARRAARLDPMTVLRDE